jgi:large subunit ribosomal protein L23
MALFGKKKETKEMKKAAAPANQSADKKAAKPKDAKVTAAPVSMQELYSQPAKITKTGGAKPVSMGKHENSYRILIKPLVTEKASNQGAANKYVFVVNKKANKIAIAKAINATFGIKPIKVNVISSDGKFVTRGRIRGQRKDWKKAIVTLPKGETIKIYEGV